MSNCVACPDGVCRLGLEGCVGPKHPGYAAKLEAGDSRFGDIIRQLTEQRGCNGCTGKPCVSIIIAARNCEPWLRDAILSAQHQTLPACELIYSDDASTDNSVEVARSLGCRVSTSSRHMGVCAARNAAARVAKGEWLLHLDGDDILPRPYLQQKLEALARDPEASFVYGAAQAFGGEWNQFWDTPEWDAGRLWQQNWVNTSTLVRRDHFWLAGGWREGIGTAWDWDLWLRLAQLGKRGVRDPHGLLLYRKHPGSISFRQGLHAGDEMDRMNYLVRAHRARQAICCVLSDRLLARLGTWLRRITQCVDHWQASVRLDPPYEPFGSIDPPAPALTILHAGDPVHREFITRKVRQHAQWFENTTILGDRLVMDRPTEQERRDTVSTFLARAYNRFLDQPEEVLWFVEDDIEPPVDALSTLHHAMMSPTPIQPVVCGWYRNRHVPTELVLHEWPTPPDRSTLRAYQAPPEHDGFVDLAGTGCMLIFKPLVSHRFGSHVGPFAAHDWNWCVGAARAGSRPYVLANVGCRHFISQSESV